MSSVGGVLDAITAALDAVAMLDGNYRPLNESETRAHLIDPVIAALGYLSLDHVRREFRLSASGQFVDYMLSAGDTRIVVEAKPVTAELSPKDASQLVGYCAQEGIRWALLTNGRTWEAFDIEVKGGWLSKRVAQLDFWAAGRSGSLGQVAETMYKFSRASVSVGDANLQAWAREERARSSMEALLRNPASSVVKAVQTEMAGQGIDLEASEVIELLRSGVVPRDEPIASDHRLEPVQHANLTANPYPVAESQGRSKEYWIFPVGSDDGFKAEEHLQRWLAAGMWGLRMTSASRTRIKVGDECCFYVAKVGVVARAKITTPANEQISEELWPGPGPYGNNVYRVRLEEVQWLESPVLVDRNLRASLDALAGKDLSKPWAWMVQSTNRITEHDFRLMVREQAK